MRNLIDLMFKWFGRPIIKFRLNRDLVKLLIECGFNFDQMVINHSLKESILIQHALDEVRYNITIPNINGDIFIITAYKGLFSRSPNLYTFRLADKHGSILIIFKKAIFEKVPGGRVHSKYEMSVGLSRLDFDVNLTMDDFKERYKSYKRDSSIDKILEIC